MSYYRELTNGQRVPVSFAQFLADSWDRGFMQLIADPSLIIYRIEKG